MAVTAAAAAPPLFGPRRPLHMMSRNGSRSKGKVDSASSLEQSEESAAQPARSGSGEQGGTAAVQEQLARATLAD